jgi:predicted GNAT family acetyltransferase
MIRQLDLADHDLVQAYLDRDPLHNIYLIHGLQTHGLDSAHVTFWGAFNEDRLEGVLFADNDYRRRFGSLAGDGPTVLARLGKLALKSEIRTLAGKSACLQPVVENLPSRFLVTQVERLNLYKIHPGELVAHHDYPVRWATTDDVPLLVELYKNYEPVGEKTVQEVEQEIRKAMDKGGDYFFLESGGRAVSAARIFPQTDRAGMIDGATTLPEFRGRGLYPCVRTACFEHLFEEEKIGLGLVSENNTIMHKIVEKYGGTFIAPWWIVLFKSKPPLRQRIIPQRLRYWALNLKQALHP